MFMYMIKKFIFLFQNKSKGRICCESMKLQKAFYSILCLFILLFTLGCKGKNLADLMSENKGEISSIQDEPKLSVGTVNETVNENASKQLEKVQSFSSVQNGPSIFNDFWGNFSDAPIESEIKVFGNIEVNDLSNDEDSYAVRSGYEAVVDVYGEYGSVEYWRRNGNLRFQLLSLEQKTDLHPLSDFIGKEYETVLNAYPADSSYGLNEHGLTYNSSNYEFFITFNLSDGIIDKIILGRNM